VVGETRPFGKYAIDGAVAGKKYGEANINDFDSLRKINDYTWILEQFNKAYNE
jgi:hypothetical protein